MTRHDLTAQEWRSVWRWVWRKKTFNRAIMNALAESRLKVSGKTLDLGAGMAPSYQESLEGQSACIFRADLDEGTRPSVVCNLEHAIPFSDNAFNFVICFNTCQYIYNFERFLSETFRILSPSGKLYISVPFIKNIAHHPTDYYRFTDIAFEKALEKAGFKKFHIDSYGGIFMAAVEVLSPVLKWGIVRFPVFLLAVGLDRAVRVFRGRTYEDRWVVVYWIEAEKE